MTERQHRSGTSETWVPRGEHIEHLMTVTVGERVKFKEGQYLFEQGEVDQRFFVLLSGKLHVYTLSDDGHESTFNIMGPGSMIGEAAALAAQPRYSTARVIEDAELIKLNVGEMERYITEDPKFAMALIYMLSVKQRQLVGRLKQAVNDAPDRRIMRLLADLAHTHCDGISTSSRMRVNLTHEQIGNLTDLSRVTVTRTLNRLKRDGLIDLVGRGIVLRRSLDSATYC